MIDILIKDLADKICKDYKISQIEAVKIINHEVEKYKDLVKEWEKQSNLKKIYRTSTYKDFSKKVKRKIYNRLRTYQIQSKSIEDTHVSTKERSAHLKKFLFQINDVLKTSEILFDVGGGIFLISFPFEDYKNIRRYIWLDKDKKSYDKVNNFVRKKNLLNVTLYNEKIGQRDWRNYLPLYKDKFDIVLMLKLIPVINRQERHLLVNLAQIPAEYILVTGSKQSMVKTKSIQKREEQVIANFINMTGKSIIKKIDIENEFGYLLK